MIANPFFKEVINYVNSNTNLVVIDIKINPISISGHVGDNVFMYLSVQVGEMGWYQCIIDISYNGYDDEFTTVFQPVKIVKTEEEVINLIEKTISISNKLMKTVHQLEKELEE